jgi:hypothetical protein
VAELGASGIGRAAGLAGNAIRLRCALGPDAPDFGPRVGDGPIVAVYGGEKLGGTKVAKVAKAPRLVFPVADLAYAPHALGDGLLLGAYPAVEPGGLDRF